MMTFYSAVGSYRIRTEDGRKIPYIQKLGKLHPISIPEFLVWSTLLWEVMSREELQNHYESARKACPVKLPDLDQLLEMLLRRKLVVKGTGYTGRDALYDMLSDAFVVPHRAGACKKAWSILQLWWRGKIRSEDVLTVLRSGRKESDDERRVYELVEQTPLSTSELIRCFEREIYDVSTPEKVIAAVYPEDESDQFHIGNEQGHSGNTESVLKAVSNLYLARKVVLETL